MKIYIMSQIMTNITNPIEKEMLLFGDIFRDSLSYNDGLLNEVLTHIMQRGGKRMRPILTLLIAKALYLISNDAIVDDSESMSEWTEGMMQKALHAACSLELLHTASLVHDDVVDEADQRRGQASVNAQYNTRVAVLVGDYILSTSLHEISFCHDERMTNALAKLGQTLSRGEVRQQQNITDMSFSIDAYYQVITQKTAALFEACCMHGALAVNASEDDIDAVCTFGRNLGIAFQIKDDIFDYYDSSEIGKPTGNDMREGKLTLPVLLVLNDENCPEEYKAMARNVKAQEGTNEEISSLIEYTVGQGGIERAQQYMTEYFSAAKSFIDERITDSSFNASLHAFADYVVGRKL